MTPAEDFLSDPPTHPLYGVGTDAGRPSNRQPPTTRRETPIAQTTSPPDPADPDGYDAAALDRARAAVNATPSNIDRYRVLERIGGGGMGEVYRAEQRTPVRREVAIKLIKLGMDTKLVIARFEAERQALAMMDHPHIAKVYDADADETGRPYFVMEYVKGRPITDYADANHLTIPERLALFEQVCHAVQHAHHKGIIHRDLKPGNVLVSTQDGRPHAKVIDFGIAKATNQQLTDKTLFTQHDQFIGTPQYMSPEQADGSLDIDTRSDVYSLGVLLYELLTGSTPFSDDEMKAVAFERLKKLIRETDPPKPSTRLQMSEPTLATLAASRRVEAKTLNTLVRGELDWIVMKALDKDRARRYDTATALVDDLRRHQSGEPVQAASPTWTYRSRKFVRKHRGPVIAAAAVTAALLTGLAGTSTFAIYAKRQQAIAVTEKNRADAATVREQARAEEAEVGEYAANISAAASAIAGQAYAEARERLDAVPQKQRCFEWNFLRQQAAAFRFAIPDHVDHAKASYDGKRIATDSGLFVRLWDSHTGTPIGAAIKIQPNNPLQSMTFTSDERLVLAFKNGQVQLLNAGDGNPIGEVTDTHSEIARTAVSASGNRLIIFDDKGAVRLWDTQTMSPIGEALVLAKAVYRGETPTFSPDGRFVATVSQNHEVQIWRSDDGKFLFSPGRSEWHECFDFTPDSRQFIALTDGQTVQLWDLPTGKRSGDAIRTASPLKYTAFSGDSQRLALCSDDGTVRVVDVGTHQTITQVQHHGVELAQFGFDGQWLVTAPKSHASRLWSVADGRAIGETFSYGDPSFSSMFDHIGQMMTAVDGRLEIADDKGKITAIADSPATQVFGEATLFDSDRAILILTGTTDVDEGYTRVGAVVADVVALQSPSRRVSANANSQLEASAVLDSVTEQPASKQRFTLGTTPAGAIEVLESGKRVASLPVYGKEATAVFTPDGRRLITASGDRTLRFWDTKTWRQIVALPQNQAVTRLRLSSEGTRLVLDFPDDSINVIDTRGPEGQHNDLAARADATLAAKRYVDQLVAGDTPTDQLTATLQSDTSLSALTKLAALERLSDMLSEKKEQTEDTYKTLRDKYVFDATMKAAVQEQLKGREAADLFDRIDHWKKWHGQSERDTCYTLSLRGYYGGYTEEKYNFSIKAAEQFMKTEPDKPEWRVILGATYYRVGRYDEAVRWLTPILSDLIPGKGQSDRQYAAAVLAMTFHALGRQAEATAMLAEARATTPADGIARDLCEEAVTVIAPATTKPAAMQPATRP